MRFWLSPALGILGLCFALQLRLPSEGSGTLGAQEIRNAVYYYRQAQDAYKIKDYRQAIDLYRRALESNPRHLASYMGAAKTYSLLGIYGQAEKSYRSILEYLPRHQGARTGLAQVLIKTGKMQPAYNLLSAVQKEEAADTENNYTFGIWHLNNGNTAQARRYFQRTLDLDPSHVPALLETAQLLITLKRPAQAKRYIERASAIDPAHPGLYQARGHLDLSLALSKREPQSRLDLMENAYKSFLTAKKLAPQNISINRQLLYLDIYRSRFDEAVSLLKELRADDKQDPKLYYLEALLKLQSGRKDQKTLRSAVQNLNQALRLNPHNSYIRHTLENLLLDHRGLHGAAALSKTLASYHLKEAEYQKSKYRHDRMSSHLNRVLHLDPLSPRSLKMRLRLLKGNKDYEALLFVYQQLLKQLPNDSKLRYRLDRALQKRGQNIAYREKLFNPVLSTQKASFKRTPKRIFVFSMQAQEFFAEYPDLSEQIGRALNMEFNQAGPLQGLKESTRADVLKYIQTIDSSRYSSHNTWGAPYRSQYINYVHEALRGKEGEIHYLISGTYRSTASGVIHAAIQLRESNTGTSVAQFRIKTRAHNALLDLAQKSRAAILKRIPIEGEIIKVKGKNLFVNLGRYDGVKAKSRFSLPSLSSKKSVLKVEEVGAYISRVRPIAAFQKQNFSKGLGVRLIPAKN